VGIEFVVLQVDEFLVGSAELNRAGLADCFLLSIVIALDFFGGTVGGIELLA